MTFFYRGKKVCGILTESGIDYEQKQLQYVVLGIGVNVGNTSFPKELETIATSIRKECQRKVSRNELIAEILKELTVWYPSLWDGSFLKESKARSNVLGKEIRVQNANAEDGFYRAKAVDLDNLGQLIIETTEGERKILNSGEVSVRF